MNILHRINNRLISAITLSKFAKHGKYSLCGRKICGYLKNVTIGSHSYIGDEARFLCSRAKVIIGNYVMLGPQTMMITGRHRYDVVGKRMSEITNEQKRDVDDLDIIIEDDVWIGAGAIVLPGVTLHKGAVVGAGAVVNKDVPEKTIVVGIPAKVLKTIE